MAMTFIRLGATGTPSENPAEHLQLDRRAFVNIGFDLDGRCTSSPSCADDDGGLIQEEHCYRPPSSVGGKAGATDGNECSDNAVGTTIPISYLAGSTSDLFGVNEGDWNCELHRGGFGVMFRIRDYNWTPNDPNVWVDVYNTMGTQAEASWKCRTSAAATEVIPNWRTEPGWQTSTEHIWRFSKANWNPEDDTSPTILPDSKVHTETAYVRDGYLVAFLPPASQIGFIGNDRTVIAGIRLSFERAILAGRLVFDSTNQRWSLKEATLGGAVDPASMLQSFDQIGYCQNNMCQSYTNVKGVLESVRDVYLDPARPPAPDDPTQPCDGMSIGMAIEAAPARGDEFIKEDDPFQTRCPPPRHPLANPQSCTCPSGKGEAECGDGGLGGAGGNGGTGGTGGMGDGG